MHHLFLTDLAGSHTGRWVKSYDQIADQRQVPLSSRFYDLSQNPDVRPCLATNGALPCLRRNSKLWHPHAKRFLAPVELAACLGLPTFESAAALAAVSMDPCRDQYGMCDLGNAMHISCVGVILGIALACASDKELWRERKLCHCCSHITYGNLSSTRFLVCN